MELEEFVSEGIRRCLLHKHHPTAFVEMRSKYGTVAAITMLVDHDESLPEYQAMKELGLTEWTLEAAVLKFRHHFSPRTIACAEQRLQSSPNSTFDAKDEQR